MNLVLLNGYTIRKLNRILTVKVTTRYNKQYNNLATHTVHSRAAKTTIGSETHLQRRVALSLNASRCELVVCAPACSVVPYYVRRTERVVQTRVTHTHFDIIDTQKQAKQSEKAVVHHANLFTGKCESSSLQSTPIVRSNK